MIELKTSFGLNWHLNVLFYYFAGFLKVNKPLVHLGQYMTFMRPFQVDTESLMA